MEEGLGGSETQRLDGSQNLVQYDEGMSEEERDRRRHWRENIFAVGLVDVSWGSQSGLDLKRGCCCRCTASVCHAVGAGRVGNMAVLRQTREDNGRPKLQVVMGPFWPFVLFCTLPLILGVSAWTYAKGVFAHHHPAVFVAWLLLTASLVVSLLLVACRDPGILYRHATPVEEDWIWNDQGLTYRPKHARYDRDCAVVVENFDHT